MTKKKKSKKLGTEGSFLCIVNKKTVIIILKSEAIPFEINTVLMVLTSRLK